MGSQPSFQEERVCFRSQYLITITSREPAHSVATVRHVMDTKKETVSFLNQDQTPVLTADQPIYALAKQIQWHWPDENGEDKFVIMFGGQHIEMAALKSIGTLLQDSGWTGALVEAGVASAGTAESFLTASNITKARQMHQITACSLYQLLKAAYTDYYSEANGNSEELMNFEVWCEKRKLESLQFKFWHLILSMELTIFTLVRSFREANFSLYCQALSELIPYFFANNNTNYARWIPVHLRDMVTLKDKHPYLAQEFEKGKFVVHKSSRDFSAKAIDQAHEQANAVIKADGGTIGLTEDPSALRRWMVAGPQVSHLVKQYEALSEAKDAVEKTSHHEQTPRAQRDFLEKVHKLSLAIDGLGNPFQEESEDLMSYEPIKKNKVDFFRQKHVSTDATKQRILKEDCQLFSKLFISCQSRECDLHEFFRHENTQFPASRSDGGKLYTCQKSQLAAILESYVRIPDTEPEGDTIIIDGSAMVNSLHPRTFITFEEYASSIILPTLQTYSRKYQRTDIVFDVYLTSSLKAETRARRGTGGRRRVTSQGKIPRSWQNFLRDNDNKTELFNFLAQHIAKTPMPNKVIVTKEENVLSNSQVDIDHLAPSCHEEADTRIFLHAKNATEEGSKVLVVKANDTDVLVIAISVLPVLQDIGLQQLWVAFGQGHVLKWIPVHDLPHNIGLEKSRGILFFHAFTGCDVVSGFRGKGKKSAWQTWSVYPEVSDTFLKLGKYPPTIDDGDMKILEKFVVLMYDRSSTAACVNDARLAMFARKQRSYETIPPTQAALYQHVKRSAYVAGVIWSQSTLRQPETLTPAEWGWIQKGEMWHVSWTTLPPIAESCQQLTKCGCKSECHGGRCKCYRFGLICSRLCSCRCVE